MNFVAGALLLACSVRDPAVNMPPPSKDGAVLKDSKTTRGREGDSGGIDGAADNGVVGANIIERGSTTEATFLAGATPPGLKNDQSGFGAASGGEEEDAPPKEWKSGPQHSRAEEDVFWLMMALTSRLPDVGSGLGMRELWLPGVPQLKVGEVFSGNLHHGRRQQCVWIASVKAAQISSLASRIPSACQGGCVF